MATIRWLNTPNWRLILAQSLRMQALKHPGLSEEQRQESLKHAQRMEELHRYLKKVGRLDKPRQR